jgi:hypothetical protein
LNLNKNAAGLHLQRYQIKDNYLPSGNRRDSRKPLLIKATHTDAQKAIARLFVSHHGRIITHAFYACSKYKQSDKIPFARRTIYLVQEKPSASPPGVFVCYGQSTMDSG